MNWLDILLLLILLVNVIGSFRKGLTREVLHLASVVLAILLGAWFYGSVAEYLRPHVSSQTRANLGGFLIIFCGVLLLGAIVSGIVGKFVRVTGLSFVDHLLGAGFGALRGVLICVALLMGVMAFSRDGKAPDAILDSRLAPYISKASGVFAAMAPHELKEGFHKTYSRAKETWAEALKKTSHPAHEAERKE